MNDALAEAAKRAGLKPDGWHAVYIEPPTSFAGTLLQGLMPKQAQSNAPMDIFAHAAWQQSLFMQRVAADLALLTGAKGIQARCLECGDFAPPAPAAEEKTWLSVLLNAFS
jgi:protease-4